MAGKWQGQDLNPDQFDLLRYVFSFSQVNK